MRGSLRAFSQTAYPYRHGISTNFHKSSSNVNANGIVEDLAAAKRALTTMRRPIYCPPGIVITQSPTGLTSPKNKQYIWEPGMLAAFNEDTWYKNEIDCYNSESSIRISTLATLGRWTDTTQRRRLPKRAYMDIGPIYTSCTFRGGLRRNLYLWTTKTATSHGYLAAGYHIYNTWCNLRQPSSQSN